MQLWLATPKKKQAGLESNKEKLVFLEKLCVSRQSHCCGRLRQPKEVDLLDNRIISPTMGLKQEKTR